MAKAKVKKSAKRKVKSNKKKKPVELRLRGNALLQYQVAWAEYESSRLRADMALHNLDLEKRNEVHRPLLNMITVQNQCAQAVREKKSVLAAVQLTVAQRKGISPEDIGHYTIDRESGIITDMRTLENATPEKD